MESSIKVGLSLSESQKLKASSLFRSREHLFTLDGLRAELKAQSLTPERLLHVCDKPKEAHGFISCMGICFASRLNFLRHRKLFICYGWREAAFDICIIEVSAYWDNAATVSGLLEADSKIVVTTGDIAHFQEDFSRWIRQVGVCFWHAAGCFRAYGCSNGSTCEA